MSVSKPLIFPAFEATASALTSGHSKRQRAFRKDIAELNKRTLYHCHTCDRTEKSDPDLEFRVSSIDDEEYCLEHLPTPGQDEMSSAA